MSTMMNSIQPKVLVRCMTYNHEHYIEDALNGFVMQKTDFPFTVVVVDDASTDNNVDVIKRFISKYCSNNRNYTEEDKEYGKVIQAQAKSNNNCHFYVIFLAENHYSDPNKRALRYFYSKFIEDQTKYVAMCEGDDYWTDPYKLQKQVDFLESHPEYDMVCARFNHLIHETGEIIQSDLYDHVMLDGADGMELKQEHFVHFAQPHPCTIIYRKGTLYDNDVIGKLKYRFDIPVYYCFLYNHRIWLMNKKMSMYRKHSGSLTDSGNTFRKNIYYAYANIYQYMPNDKILRQLCAKYFRSCIAMPNVIEKNYNTKTFFKDYITYLSYRPTFRKKISFMYKVSQLRLNMYIHKNI